VTCPADALSERCSVYPNLAVSAIACPRGDRKVGNCGWNAAALFPRLVEPSGPLTMSLARRMAGV